MASLRETNRTLLYFCKSHFLWDFYVRVYVVTSKFYYLGIHLLFLKWSLPNAPFPNFTTKSPFSDAAAACSGLFWIANQTVTPFIWVMPLLIFQLFLQRHARLWKTSFCYNFYCLFFVLCTKTKWRVWWCWTCLISVWTKGFFFVRSESSETRTDNRLGVSGPRQIQTESWKSPL